MPVPPDGALLVHGWNTGRDGGEERWSFPPDAFCVRERAEAMEPDRACKDASALLPLRVRLWFCRRCMAGLVVEGLGENGSCVAILCELDGKECGVAIGAANQIPGMGRRMYRVQRRGARRPCKETDVSDNASSKDTVYEPTRDTKAGGRFESAHDRRAVRGDVSPRKEMPSLARHSAAVRTGTTAHHCKSPGCRRTLRRIDIKKQTVYTTYYKAVRKALNHPAKAVSSLRTPSSRRHSCCAAPLPDSRRPPA